MKTGSQTKLIRSKPEYDRFTQEVTRHQQKTLVESHPFQAQNNVAGKLILKLNTIADFLDWDISMKPYKPNYEYWFAVLFEPMQKTTAALKSEIGISEVIPSNHTHLDTFLYGEDDFTGTGLGQPTMGIIKNMQAQVFNKSLELASVHEAIPFYKKEGLVQASSNVHYLKWDMHSAHLPKSAPGQSHEGLGGK